MANPKMEYTIRVSDMPQFRGLVIECEDLRRENSDLKQLLEVERRARHAASRVRAVYPSEDSLKEHIAVLEGQVEDYAEQIRSLREQLDGASSTLSHIRDLVE